MTPVMQSMEMTENEVESAPLPMEMPREKWPYGLRICLTTQELDKLKLDPSEAVIGGLIHLHGMARITCVSTNEMEGGERSDRVECQIESLAIESEDEENALFEQSMQDKRRKMYNRS